MMVWICLISSALTMLWVDSQENGGAMCSGGFCFKLPWSMPSSFFRQANFSRPKSGKLHDILYFVLPCMTVSSKTMFRPDDNSSSRLPFWEEPSQILMSIRWWRCMAERRTAFCARMKVAVRKFKCSACQTATVLGCAKWLSFWFSKCILNSCFQGYVLVISIPPLLPIFVDFWLCMCSVCLCVHVCVVMKARVYHLVLLIV